MQIAHGRVVVEKVIEEPKEGYQEVQVQDSSTFKGRVVQGEYSSITMNFKVGDILLFAQNSPDTHLIQHEGKEIKFIRVEDILAVL